MNTATLPPWLAPWSGGLVYGQRVYKASSERFRGQDRRHRPRLTIYTYGHDSAPILRFSSWSEGGSGAGPGGTVLGQGVVSLPPPAGGAPVRWERVPLDHEPWHVDVPVPIQPALDPPPRYDVTIHSDVEYSPGGADGGADSTAAGMYTWSGVLRGWAAGATLLALLVVIARLAEKFLDWKYLLRRRRMQREWQRANVRATCRLDGEHPLPADLTDVCSGDLPPPYSECPPVDAVPKDEDRLEEPPPPYSDSCVQFVNKNGIPVLVYSRDPNQPETEGQRQVERILQACGININAAVTHLAPTGNIPSPTEMDDENLGMIQYFAQTQAMNAVDDNVDPPSDFEDDPVAPNYTDGAPNDTDAATNDIHIASNDIQIASNDIQIASNDIHIASNDAPIDIEFVPVGNTDDPNDGSVVV